MKKFLFSLLGFILLLCLLAVVFVAVVLISANANGLTFYDQLVTWFGPGSGFAALFKR
ncbi:MAG: hypothetical protein IJF75_03020 [Clostridia bacterium]|nr:hypothetical protein [Clostridia bacterium]MBQ4122494.1 hypothetical protein [bacterium]